MQLDSEIKDVIKYLVESGILRTPRGGIDISKLLDNKKLDMWLLELVVRYSEKFQSHALHNSSKKRDIYTLEGITEYCSIRDIGFESPQMYKELDFIRNFAAAILEDEQCI